MFPVSECSKWNAVMGGELPLRHTEKLSQFFECHIETSRGTQIKYLVDMVHELRTIVKRYFRKVANATTNYKNMSAVLPPYGNKKERLN